MIRDILNAVVNAANSVQPAGTSGPTANPANTGSGSVTFDASNQVFGTFNGLIQILTSGPPGTATAKMSLDYGGNVNDPNNNGNFGPTFTLPAAGALQVPLLALSPPNSSPALSGLALDFSGSFNAGDSFVFAALPTISWLFGEEELSSQDGLFPRVVLFPSEDDFEGTRDYAQGYLPPTEPRSLVTAVSHFEAHCWGIDLDRAECLRDTVVNGIHYAVQATKVFLRGHWQNTKKLDRAGALYVLKFSVLKPVLALNQDVIAAQPPFTADITTEVESQ